MAEGPRAQSQRARAAKDSPRAGGKILGWLSGTEDPVETLREFIILAISLYYINEQHCVNWIRMTN